MDQPPQQWHVYVVDLAPRVDTKPGKRRACVAVQPSEFAAAGHPSTVILPLTSRLSATEAFPLRLRIPAGIGGLERDRDVLVDQMLAWDNALFREELGLLPEALQDELRRAMMEFLDLRGDLS